MNAFQKSDRIATLSHLLRIPLRVTNVHRQEFAAGQGAKDDVITTSRFILILSGELVYTIEDRVFRLREGTQFFVPAWVRRLWVVPEETSCEIIWCEFDDDSPKLERSSCLHRTLPQRNIKAETRKYQELERLFVRACRTGKTDSDDLLFLQMEAMLKAMIAVFWAEAELEVHSTESVQNQIFHPAVKEAIRWMERNFEKSDVLDTVFSTCELTPNYFRQCFRNAMKCSPQEFLQRLRLRHARYLIRSTNWQQKRIALEVGYDDPLYFSRLYTRFWGRSPTDERNMVKRGRGEIK